MAASAQHVVAFRVTGPIEPSDVPGLCERVCALLQANRGAVVLCDVHGVEADAVIVDALARLQLAARRHGCSVWLRRASNDLLDLVAFMGLSDVFPG
jgi:ABC-type transporter Mla MlaB component